MTLPSNTQSPSSPAVEEVPRVVQVIVGLVAPSIGADVGPDRHLIGDLGFHSLALAELGFTLEDLFGLDAVTPEQAMSLQTVGEITAVIQEAVAAGTAQVPTYGQIEDLCRQYGVKWDPAP